MSDAQTIDKLAIQITSSVTGANKIEKFAKSLDVLADTTARVKTNTLSGVAIVMRSLAKSANELDSSKITKITNSLVRLGEVKPDLTGLKGMSDAIVGLKNIADNAKGVSSLTNSLGRLAKVDMGKFNNGEFNNLLSSIRTFSTELAQVGSIDGNVTKLVGSLAKLGNSGSRLQASAESLPKFGRRVVALVKDFQGIGTIEVGVASLVDSIARLANAGAKAGVVAKNLNEFGDAVVRLLNKLKNVGSINTNIASTIQGLGNLANSGVKFGNVANTVNTHTSSLGNGFKRLGSLVARTISPFNSFKNKLGIADKHSKGLASTIGLLYVKFFALFRLIKGLGSATASAQDYIEAFNYFNVAIDKVGNDSRDQFRRYGYESAQAYADSFRGRLTKLQKQMTGFDINPNTGDLSYKAGRSLGLNATDVLQYQAQVTQITNSTGQLGEVSVNAAKAMSMLAADFSSLTNTDMTQVQENFMSALNGQTRAVYKYGVNLTSASLQQIAYNHGIDQSVAKLSMATKQQLRLIGMLEQSKVAYGDLGRTINQPANQLRMLQAGFSNIARTIGSLFLPALQAIYPVINGLVMVLQEFFQWLAKIMGVKLPDMSTAIKPPDMETPADDAGDLADNTGKAAKNAKKLSDNLQGFDEINKLDKIDDATGNGGNGGKGIGDFDLSNDISDLLKNYEKIWNDAFNSTQNKAYKWAKKIKDALLKGWNNGGDFTFLGLELGQKISERLSKIPWEKIQAGVTKVTRAFATFLNGVVKGTDWNVIGHTIAEAFNTIIDALYTWYDTFDFLELGKSLATGLNKIISDFKWKKFGNMLGKKLRSMIQFAFGFITTFNFTNLGDKIADAINGFLEDMGKVDPRTGLSGWAELGKSLSDGAKGILDTIITILDKADWDKIGEAIADFFEQIDWAGVLSKLAKVFAKLASGAWKALTSAFKKNPEAMTQSIIAIIGGLFAFGKLKGLIGIIKTSLGRIFNIGVSGAVNSIGGIGSGGIGVGGGGGLFGKLFSKLGGAFKTFGSNLSTNFMTGFAPTFAGQGLGKGILAGLKGAMGTGIGTLGFAAAGGAAAYGFGKLGGKMINDLIDAQRDEEQTRHEGYKLKGRSNSAVTAANTNKHAKENDRISRYTDAGARRVAQTREYFSSQKDLHDAEVRYNKQAKEHDRIIADLNKRYKEGKITREAYEYALEREVNIYGAEAQEILKARAAHQSIESELRREQGIQKKLNALKDAGVISSKRYKKALDQAIASGKNETQAISTAISNTKAYKNATLELTDKLTKANVPSEQQRVILGKLKTALMEGRISMKEYKNIVESSGNSVQKLTKRINNIPAKKKTTLIFSQTGFESIQKYLSSIPRTIPVNVQATTTGGQQMSGSEYRSRSALTTLAGSSIAFEQMKNAGRIAFTSDGTIKLKEDLYKRWAKKLKKSGYKVQKFAQGGFVEDGLFTMNRQEMAGKFDNGKSVVANNQQITEGFAQGITKTLAPAIYSAVKQALSESSESSDQPIKVYLDGKQIADNSVKYIRQMNRSNGRSVLA